MTNQLINKTYLYRQFQCFYNNILLCCFPKINCPTSSATCDSCNNVIIDTYASCVSREEATCNEYHTYLKSPTGCVLGCIDEVNLAICACCAYYDADGNYIPDTYAQMTNLCSVATSGLYSDLSGQPTCLSEFTNNCNYTSCTGTVTGINVYNNGTCACTVDDSTALCLGCNAFTNTAYITASDSITGNAATATNACSAICDSQGLVICDTYATKNEMATYTATFRGSFATWSDVPVLACGYCCNYAGCCAPSPNDYMVVQDATGYCSSCVGQYRFKYTAEAWDDSSGALCKACWAPEYEVNEVLDTSPTQNSTNGITSGAVYTGLSGKADCGDIPTNNCQLSNGCNYITNNDLPNYGLSTDSVTVGSYTINRLVSNKAIVLPLGCYANSSGMRYGFNANNSDIINVNGIYTKDTAEGYEEGLNFYRDSTHNDSMYAANGHFYFGACIENFASKGSSTTGADNSSAIVHAATFCGNLCGKASCAIYDCEGQILTHKLIYNGITNTNCSYSVPFYTDSYTAYTACNTNCDLKVNPYNGLVSGRCICASTAMIIPVGTSSNTTNGAIWITI